MSTPTARARAERAEQLAEELERGIQDSENGTLYLADNAVDRILAYADEIRREERATLQAAITQSAREIRRLEKRLVEAQCPCDICTRMRKQIHPAVQAEGTEE